VIAETAERREFARAAPVHLAVDSGALLALRDAP